MKAILSKPHMDGTYDEVGMNNRIVVGPYKTIRNIIRYGIPDRWKGMKIRMEVFYNDNILADPNITVFHTKF